MAESKHDGSDPHNSSVEQFFDFGIYYEENSTVPESTPNVGPQASSGPRSSERWSRFELNQEQVGVSAAAAASLDHEITFKDTRLKPLERHVEPTGAGNQPLRQYKQSSLTNHSMTELQEVDEELEQINLELRRKELQKKRRALLQTLPPPTQAQTPERPQFQNTDTAIIPFVSNTLGQPCHESTSTSGMRSMSGAHVDSRYDGASTNPSYFRFANLSNGAQGESSHIGFPEQSSRTDAGLSRLDPVDLLGSMPAGPLDSSFDHQVRLQGPMPAPVSNQASMRPLLAGSQHRHGLDPIQPVSAISSVQHIQPVQNPDQNMIIRKRPKSHRPTEAQLLSAFRNQVSKRGVPEISLGLICCSSEPAPKRSRTSFQKQNKKDVENAGGACFSCVVFKKKVSPLKIRIFPNLPLTEISDSAPINGHVKIVQFTGRNVSTTQRASCGPVTFKQSWQASTSTNTPKVRFFPPQHLPSVLVEFLQGISNSTTVDTCDSQFGGVKTFERKLVYLLSFPIRKFEGSRPRSFLTETNISERESHFSTYIHSLIHWKDVLVYSVPKRPHFLAFPERLSRNTFLQAIDFCDRVHRVTDRITAVMAVVLTFDEINFLRATQKVDHLMADHLQLALQYRLTVFCARIFDFDESKEVMWDERKASVMMMVDCVPELSSCLPPQYRGCSRSYELFIKYATPLRSPITPPDLPSCLLRRSDSSEDCYDCATINNCCCGWTFDSTPSGLLSFFGHSARSFARYVHAEPPEISLGKVKVLFDARQAMITVFGEPWMDNSSLHNRKAIFWATMSFLLQHSFHTMNYSINSINSMMASNINTTRKIPEDRLDRLADNLRQQVFARFLRSAVTMYHSFWNEEREEREEREGKTDAETTGELLRRFGLWAEKKKTTWETDQTREIYDFSSALVSRREPWRSLESHDTDAFPHADGSSNALGEKLSIGPILIL